MKFFFAFTPHGVILNTPLTGRNQCFLHNIALKCLDKLEHLRFSNS